MRASTSDRNREEILAALAHARTVLEREASARGRRWALLLGPLIVVLTIVVLGLINSHWAWAFVIVPAILFAVSWVPRFRLRRELNEPHRLAGLLESALPELRNDIQAALQLPEKKADSDEAQALRDHLSSRVAKALPTIVEAPDAAERVLPARNITLERRVGAGAAALALLLAFVAPSFKSAFQASAPTAASEDGVSVDFVVGSLSADITPPPYTELPMERIPSVTNSLKVFEGSTLMLTGTIFRPVDQGWAQLGSGENAQRIPLAIDGYSEFILPLSLTETTEISFYFQDRQHKIRDQRKFTITVQNDQAPKIDILSPTEAVEITGSEVVPIAYEVSDDFGVSQTELVWWFVGAEQDVSRLPLLGPSGKWAEDTAPFDPAPLYMQPGDQVLVHIEAKDNRGVNGPQTTLSAPVLVMISEEPKPEEELLTIKEALFESLLEQLGAQLAVGLSGVEPDGKGSYRDVVFGDLAPEENAKRVKSVQASLPAWSPIIDQFDAYIELAETVETLDPKQLRTMQQLRSVLFEREREARRVIERVEVELESGTLPSSRTTPIGQFHASHIRETERAVLALRSLISDHKAEDVARSLAELNTIKDRIRDLLEQYRDTRDENLRARIERELNRLSERMNELLEKLSSQVEQLPQEHFNEDGMEQGEAAENVQQMGDSMRDIREKLNAGDIDGALQALDQLQSALDAMNEEFGDPFQNADDETLSEFDQQMGEVMEEVTALEHAQQELERENAALQQEMVETQRQAIRDQLEQKIQEAMQQVREASENSAQARQESSQESVTEAFDQALQDLESLRRRLDSQDIANAEDAALDAQQALQRAAAAAERARALTQEPNAQRALREQQQRATQDARRMREISESMSELQRNMQPNPNAQQQAQMQQMAQRQGELQQRAQQVQQRLGEMGEAFPMMGEGASEPMESAQQRMGEASQQLSQRQGRPAQSSQGQALDSLRSVRQQLQQQVARQRQAQQQRNRGRGRTETDRVEIPQEQDRDLRQREQIMDAMREGSLEQWQDPIRQYYESLVR